jgi:hypothetical protein
MGNIYLVAVDESGKAHSGASIPIDGYLQVTEDIYNNIGRAFYIDGEWVIYERLSIAKSSDEPISVGDEITVTATLPADSPDSAVTFSVVFNGVLLSEPVEVAVSDGQAVQAYIFDKPGYYTVSASSTHHGGAATVIVVKEAEA